MKVIACGLTFQLSYAGRCSVQRLAAVAIVVLNTLCLTILCGCRDSDVVGNGQSNDDTSPQSTPSTTITRDATGRIDRITEKYESGAMRITSVCVGGDALVEHVMSPSGQALSSRAWDEEGNVTHAMERHDVIVLAITSGKVDAKRWGHGFYHRVEGVYLRGNADIDMSDLDILCTIKTLKWVNVRNTQVNVDVLTRVDGEKIQVIR